MGRYGEAAIKAVTFITDQTVSTPLEAWDKATRDIFGQVTWAQVKGCPRSSFLGLCEEALVRGVPSGNYCRSEKNKRYALKAVELIEKDTVLADDHHLLWKQLRESAIHNRMLILL